MSTEAAAAAQPEVPARMILLLAAACGLVVANLYYAQPLIALIAPDLGLHPAAASLIVTLTQTGYCAGLVLLAPLGDLLENRRLVLCTLCLAVTALIAAALAPSAAWFLIAALCIGLGSVAVQMLVPIAGHMAPNVSRGRVVGSVVSGLLTGIMLARPLSSLVASAFGWRAVFGLSAVVTAAVGLTLRYALPQRHPQAGHGYGELLASLWTLLRDTPLLRPSGISSHSYSRPISLYWTAVPLLLSGPLFHLGQRGIALFALAGAAGALAAPVAGRLADRGHTHVATGASLLIAAGAFALAWFGVRGSLLLLLAGGVVLDLGVQANLVLGQRAIYELGAHVRSRLNGLYIALFFLGGAFGSAIASITFAKGGWALVSELGCAFPVVALLFYAGEPRASLHRG